MSVRQFVGSRLSLITIDDIRYEGTVYAIDSGEATISMAKVRSFGTEDRPVERPIPVSYDEYELLIFHSDDLKWLDMLQPAGESSEPALLGQAPQPDLLSLLQQP